MSSKSDGAWLNRAFGALSESLRREIVDIVGRNAGISVNELCARFPISRFAIMRHLNMLEDAELLYREREGQSKRLFVDREKLLKLADGWLRRAGSGD